MRGGSRTRCSTALSDDIELAAVLEKFDERITERGWVFDEELSDEESALWYFIPSTAEVPDDGEVVPVTTIAMTSDDVPRSSTSCSWAPPTTTSSTWRSCSSTSR